MPMKQSAGILLFRKINSQLEVLLVHPGGPFWKNKDEGAWTIPKGEFTSEEPALYAAKREFKEETGTDCDGAFIQLPPIKLKSGKTIYVWALEKDFDTASLKSNVFDIEWPPKSGKQQPFPEIDKAAWFTPAQAKEKINAGQAPLIDELLQLLK